MQEWNSYLDENKDRFLDELLALLRIPSVSADSKYKGDVARCAEAVKESLLKAGADMAEICPTSGHPIVYGEKIIDPSKPTVLVYGHYDVQPADPLDLWDSPPFEPVIKDGKIFARGACDDKGQMYMHVKAFEVMSKTNTLACNVKFMIEGEEEVGSSNLGIFLEDNKEKLAADIVLVSDTSMISMENPSIETGLRGLAYMEVEVDGPNRDLHSGVYGGAVNNPINELCRMIASLHDENGHITVKGFYDKVDDLTAAEKTALNNAPFDQKEYNEELGIGTEWGEKGYSNLERTGTRPTLDVNGIWGGYTGEGAKTVLPAKAFAKISMRLVPHQSSDEIAKLFTDHFKSLAPASVKVKVTAHHGGEPVVTPTDSIAYKAAAKAIATLIWQRPHPDARRWQHSDCSTFRERFGLENSADGLWARQR